MSRKQPANIVPTTKSRGGRTPRAQAQRTQPGPIIQTRKSQAAMSPEQALELLKAGNERFVTGRMSNRDLREQVSATAGGQFPYAVILSCQDSRTSSEVLFDLNKGDAFSIRIAGNVVNEDVLGGLEFSTRLMGAKLIVVIGHTRCGAINGAIDNAELGNLTALLRKIRPAVESSLEDGQTGSSQDKKLVEAVAKANVLLAMRQIREQSPVVRELLEAGRVGLVGGMYNLTTGKVKFYENQN
ncbi:MAG: carbonic anhydrase [Acidobacteria bacterium]|nr:carbonic anhydrase [Acidobacteriota bacterium]